MASTERSPSSIPVFNDMSAEPLEAAAVEASYAQLHEQWAAASTAKEREEVILRWDAMRRSQGFAGSLAGIRFHQDTKDPDNRTEREKFDRLQPKLMELSARFQGELLDGEFVDEIKETFGGHVLDLWAADRATVSTDVEEDLVRESTKVSSYTELLGSARIEFRGDELNLSRLAAFSGNVDRETRHEAARAYWAWFADKAETFDSLYDELVHLRTGIARKLGHDTFVPLAYQRKRRTDYDSRDVARFREQIVTDVVPIAADIIDRQGKENGLSKVMLWDEAMREGGAPPEPVGGSELLTAKASELFKQTLPELSELYELMVSKELLDLDARDGKAPGGFCAWLSDHDVPFIFANFNGTHGDARVFTHEMGHAFQRYSSRDHRLGDTIGCTSESAEIHSMSLEFLTWPQMDLFFGDKAEHFRKTHLRDQLLFLPYGALVDHFQHRVYEEPDATPDERASMWLELEKIYMPWRDAGDLEHVAGGRLWQRQLHIYRFPFYYIDYTLALTCALQFWDRSCEDSAGAYRSYEALCRKGGSMPFRELVRSAGLRQPFDEGCLASVVGRARAYLEE